MNLTHLWMQSEWGKALGWTFIHSLWQIAVIGFLLYVMLKLIPGRSAHVRYMISTMAIWMIVITVLSTFIVMLPDSKPVTEITGQVVFVKSAGEYSLSDRISMWLEARMPVMLSIWFGGVLILMLRLTFSLGWVRHMRSSSTSLDSIQLQMNELIHRLQLRIKPRASASGYVSSPVTIGHIKPLILFPIGIINQLTTQEVEAILTHELAHIVRRDYLSNLIQSFIETLFYYHPVTWWISNMVRTERENRADDLAVTWCGDHLGYAKALITVEEMQLGHSPSLAIGFASKKGAMLARIQRILHIPNKNHNQMEKTVLISLCSLFFLGFTLNSHPNQNKDKETIAQEKTIVTVDVTVPDSIPSNGTYKIHKKTDNQDISVEVRDGDIRELHVDGKEIAPNDFDKYGKVIDDLFGEVETPPTTEGFDDKAPAMPSMNYSYTMPPMPAMAPRMTYGYAMPSMPDMSQMKEIQIENLIGDGSDMEKLNGDLEKYIQIQIDSNINVISDSLIPRCSKIIIIHNGDSTVLVSPKITWSGDSPAEDLAPYLQNNEDWKQHEQEWKQLAEEYKQNWQDHARQWQEDWRDQQEQLKAEQERLRGEGDRIQEETRERMQNGDYDREMKEAQEAEGMARSGAYGWMAPRMNMTDAMIEEGLVKPGEEADIVLTPDKLKINGKKMPDEIHEKYLRMYEDQQGIELSGNSKVEFKTKSHRSM